MRFVPAVLWAALIFYLSSRHHVPDFFARIEGSDKVVHASVYAVLCACLLWGARGPRGASMWWCVLVCSLYGVSDEYHQGFVPGRTQDVWDWVADTLGAAVCVLLWRHFGPALCASYQRLQTRFKRRTIP